MLRVFDGSIKSSMGEKIRDATLIVPMSQILDNIMIDNLGCQPGQNARGGLHTLFHKSRMQVKPLYTVVYGNSFK